MRFRSKLAESCAKSGSMTTPRLGDGGPDARSRAIQALAASVSSCHTIADFTGLLMSYCVADWLPISKRNGISGPTGMYS